MTNPQPRSTQQPGKVVLLRHAQSLWNLENRFTGWADVGLTSQGIDEAHRAGAALRQHGFTLDVAFVSRLVRATKTLEIVLDELGQRVVPVIADWRLNERHYGALQGVKKDETAARYGDAQFQRWRRGWADRPPAVTHEDARHPIRDAAYDDVARESLPATESLADTYQRVIPYWQEIIVPRLARGDNVLVVSHNNTLRALVKHLDVIDEHAIEQLEIPTGRPMIYRFTPGMRPLQSYDLLPVPQPLPPERPGQAA